MSKKRYRTKKKNLPSVFNTSQVFTQAGEIEQQKTNLKPNETSMAVNDRGNLVWKYKKDKMKPYFSMDMTLSAFIWLILTIGLLALHIWIWDYVNEDGHLAIWFFNVFFFLCFIYCVDIDFDFYTEWKDVEKPFKVKQPKELGSEPVSDSLQITKDKVK